MLKSLHRIVTDQSGIRIETESLKLVDCISLSFIKSPTTCVAYVLIWSAGSHAETIERALYSAIATLVVFILVVSTTLIVIIGRRRRRRRRKQ